MNGFLALGGRSFFASGGVGSLHIRRWVGLLAIGVACVAFAAQEPLPPTAEAMAELRRIEGASYHQSALDPFRMKYQDQARANPTLVMPRVYVAWCTLPSDDAWNQLKAISTIYPDHPWVRYGMGRIYTTWKSMTDLARTEFEAVLKRDPTFFPALVGLGDVARVKKDFVTAEEKYRAALALNDDPFAHAGLGLALAAQDKKAEALVELKKAIAAHPEQPAAVNLLVKLTAETKDPDAVKAAEALCELRPKEREARKLLADLRFDGGDKAGAAKEYERLVRLGNPEQPVLQRLAELDRELGDAESEERNLTVIAALDDKNPAPNLRIAELRLARKDYEGAEGQWLEALARDPKLVSAQLGMAHAHLEQGLLTDALLNFRQALKLDPAQPEALAKSTELEARFRLPKRKPKGKADNVFWAVHANLLKFFEEKQAANRELEGRMRLRVRINQDNQVTAVDVLEDTLKDPELLGNVYFGLFDSEFVGLAKADPVFDFIMGKKQKGK